MDFSIYCWYVQHCPSAPGHLRLVYFLHLQSVRTTWAHPPVLQVLPTEHIHVLHSHQMTTFWYTLTQTHWIMKHSVFASLPVSHVTELNGRRPSRRTQPSGSPSSAQTTSGLCGWLRNPVNRSDKQRHVDGICNILSESCVSCVSQCKPDPWGLWPFHMHLNNSETLN